MMVITARFPSRCQNCQGVIVSGMRIQYERGRGTWHAGCATVDGRYTEDEREDLRAYNAQQIAAGEQDFDAEWTRETTIERRAVANAARVRPSEIDLDGYAERIDMNLRNLKSAIAYHGLQEPS